MIAEDFDTTSPFCILGASSFEPDVACSVSVKHSYTEAVLLTCLSSGWATTTGGLLLQNL